MHTKAFASGAGVKKIHTPLNPSAARTLSVHTINALVKLLRKQGVTGITLWLEEDEEVEQLVYHLEAGHEQFISSDVSSCILNAVGEMPLKQCGGPCGQEKPLDLFPRNAASGDGRGWYCNVCNRKISARQKVTA